MTAHVHAKGMLLYAKDAEITDKPWQLWEYCSGEAWRTLTANPGWTESTAYRRKPQTIKIGDYEFPMPMQEAPKVGTEYWVVSLAKHNAPRLTWVEDETDKRLLKSGFCHTTQEAAEQHSKVLIAISGGQV